MNNKYLFKSERLGFRTWQQSDVAIMAMINADPDVMEFFKGVKTHEETEEFVERMQKLFEENGYCYFAVDLLANNEFIGFIGLSQLTFAASFTPCIDIGWKICKKEWNKGYGTEGALKCLDYAFNNLGIRKVYSTTPKINSKSEHIMRKIGMKKALDFIHPLLAQDPRLRECVLYEIPDDEPVIN